MANKKIINNFRHSILNNSLYKKHNVINNSVKLSL